MESVQTDSTIEFAIVENPHNHLQNQKYHSQKKTWAPGIQPRYTILNKFKNNSVKN